MEEINDGERREEESKMCDDVLMAIFILIFIRNMQLLMLIFCG